MNNASLIAALVVTTGLGIARAPAAPSVSVVGWEDARSLAVEHKDLNLTTAAGVTALQRRIEEAVERVCALPNARNLTQRVRAADCRTVALRQGLDQAGRIIAEAQLSARAN